MSLVNINRLNYNIFIDIYFIYFHNGLFPNEKLDLQQFYLPSALYYRVT